MTDKTHVLFVCHGNICRSPLAEGIFRQLVQDAGVSERYEIDSAGTSSYHEGEAPDPRTSAEAMRRGIVLEHSARRIQHKDLGRFDHVLVMDQDNLAAVQEMAAGSPRHAVVRLLRTYDATAGDEVDVPDPYYGGETGFSDVHDMVERACRAFLSDLTSASAREDA